MDTDAPVIALSWQDAGSGVLTFVTVALLLGLCEELRTAFRSLRE